MPEMTDQELTELKGLIVGFETSPSAEAYVVLRDSLFRHRAALIRAAERERLLDELVTAWTSHACGRYLKARAALSAFDAQSETRWGG